MNIAIIKAGGIGSRMGSGVPKQFITVDGKPIIVYTMEAFQHHPGIDRIIVVCVKGWDEILRLYAENYGITKLEKIVEGGETSLKSIQNGVYALREEYKDDDIILIHDANRPLVSQEIISDVLVESKLHGMAVAAIPCNDEVGIIDINQPSSSRKFADHKTLYRIQTPDAYRLETILKILDNATEEQLIRIGSTNVLAIAQGYEMRFANGSETNIRLTTQEDITHLEAILKARNR